MLMTSGAALSLFEVADDLFQKHFDQREFTFSHRLADDPIFEPQRLLEIERQMAQNQVSISLNINFHYKDHLLADVYRATSWLRRMGLGPTPPSRSLALDRFKAACSSSARSCAMAGRPSGGQG